MVTERQDPVWVVDSPVGHLAVAHRAGVLADLLGHPTRLFRSMVEVRDALPSDFKPCAMVFGYAEIEVASDLVLNPPDPALESIPIFISDMHRSWPLESLPAGRVFINPDPNALSYTDGLVWFRDHVLDDLP